MVLDDEDRENEGDMIFAAETVTVEQMALTDIHCAAAALAAPVPDRIQPPAGGSR